MKYIIPTALALFTLAPPAWAPAWAEAAPAQLVADYAACLTEVDRGHATAPQDAARVADLQHRGEACLKTLLKGCLPEDANVKKLETCVVETAAELRAESAALRARLPASIEGKGFAPRQYKRALARFDDGSSGGITCSETKVQWDDGCILIHAGFAYWRLRDAARTAQVAPHAAPSGQ